MITTDFDRDKHITTQNLIISQPIVLLRDSEKQI